MGNLISFTSKTPGPKGQRRGTRTVFNFIENIKIQHLIAAGLVPSCTVDTIIQITFSESVKYVCQREELQKVGLTEMFYIRQSKNSFLSEGEEQI